MQTLARSAPELAILAEKQQELVTVWLKQDLLGSCAKTGGTAATLVILT
jgi:hypothetical protein